jgi:hypothetical protein
MILEDRNAINEKLKICTNSERDLFIEEVKKEKNFKRFLLASPYESTGNFNYSGHLRHNVFRELFVESERNRYAVVKEKEREEIGSRCRFFYL